MKLQNSRFLRYIRIIIFMIIIMLLLPLSSSHIVLGSIVAHEPEIEMLKAIVVMKSASGNSYIADRESIMSMPALRNEEEMENFISQYRANSKTVYTTIASLEDMGFTVTTHDDIFVFIIGTPGQFTQLFPTTALTTKFERQATKSKQAIFTTDELHRQVDYIDGIIVYTWLEDDAQTATSSSTNTWKPKSPDVKSCKDNPITVSEVMHYLAVDRAHSRGLKGEGVRIGFIDQGVYTGHPFFFPAPLDIQLYRFVKGTVTRVGNNFEGLGHGTMVAAYLNAVAPRAQLLSFAKPVDTRPWEEPIAEYINYMHAHNSVDIISLSQAWDEEDVITDTSTIPEIRTQMIYAIAKGTVIFVGAGNSGQEGASHNVLAAIPEVIAVGGATVNGFLDFSAAGGYDVGGITGAASFDSVIFKGRHVPDVVGIFGDNLCYPWPLENNYSNYDNSRGICGTSGTTPQIAGIAALLIEQDPSITPTQVRAILEGSALDITTGQSGDGDNAAEGYDAATGYGLPLATWVLNEHTVLHEGWNLIGLLKEHSTAYSAVDMLNEINNQGGNCDTISYWDSGRYKSIIVRDGEIYGFDFDLTPDMGYWVRCSNRSLWNPSGTSYIGSPHTVNFNAGWNLFAVPYANAPCTVDDLGYETGWKCWHVVKYDGQMRNWQATGAFAYGNNFLLRAGQGYFVRCDESVTWTPDCSRYLSTADTNTTPHNVFSSQASRIPVPSMNFQNMTETRSSQMETINATITNVTDQQFSVSWNTATPGEGALLITDGYKGDVMFTAFDDRGANFSGQTHHITLRGLKPETIYDFALVSDNTIFYDNSSGQPFQATTGKVLNSPSNSYDFHGHIYDGGGNLVHDAVLTAYLWSAGETSAVLSFPVGPGVEGYAIMLDNARNMITGEYANYLAAEKIMAEVAGNAGTSMGMIDVDLGTSPSVTYDFVLGLRPSEKTTAFRPDDAQTIDVLTPTFAMHTVDESSDNLTYRLELSRDNFATIERRYDQREDTTGWSASSYASRNFAYFIPPDPLMNFVAYQWRVFVYNGTVWNSMSDIASFAVEAPVEICKIFLPLVLRAH